MKVRKAEALNTFKREAQRLLSEKNVVDALNNLSSTIKEQLDFAATEGDQGIGQGGGQVVNVPGQGPGKGGGKLSFTVANPANEKTLNQIQAASENVSRLTKDSEVQEGALRDAKGVVSAQQTQIEKLNNAISKVRILLDPRGAMQFYKEPKNVRHANQKTAAKRSAQSRFAGARTDAMKALDDAGQSLLKKERVEFGAAKRGGKKSVRFVDRDPQSIMNELKKTRDEALRGQKKSRGDEAAAERMNF